jgi:membrane-associated phospholipid phosphatase
MTVETLTIVESVGAPAPAASPVRYWNGVLLAVFREAGGAPGPLARTAAMMHGAIFDVVNNQTRVDGGLDFLPYQSYLGDLPTSPGASVVDAVNVAARDVLLALHPASEATIAGAYAAGYPAGSAPATSPLGRAAAQAMLRLRVTDGADVTTPYVPEPVPGAWRPTSPGTTAATPHWGRVTPFWGGSGAAFRPPLPGGFAGYPELLASQLYVDQVTEVRILGRLDSTVRTPEQTEIGWFWANDLDGTYKPVGHLLQLTDDITPPDPDLLAEARLFALMSFALADATIVAWDSKYHTGVDLWRPETAIRLAGTDGNVGTVADPDWRPLSATREGVHFSPNFPAYVSGHATMAGAWAGILQRYVGTDTWSFTATSEDPHVVPGTTRTFASFSQAAIENARSRVYLGVHFQFDADLGLAAGAAVAQHVFRARCYELPTQ